MSELLPDTTKKDNLKRTSVSVAVNIVEGLKIAWHEECATEKKNIPQQEFTDAVLLKYLESRGISL